ncbi:MAG TPA: hypothetical protein VM141_09600 [Planctomycetota bacterium]|nr:hypothetical protein [Planctomycetota bacterium]
MKASFLTVAACLAAFAVYAAEQPTINWAADSSTVLTVRFHENMYELLTLNADEFQRTILSRSQTQPISPSISPDAGTVAYLMPRDNGEVELHVVNTESRTDRMVMRCRLDNPHSASLCWSPAGGLIALGNWKQGAAPAGVCTTLADGTAVRTISRANERACHPAWSPDGTCIAYYSLPLGKRSWDLVIASRTGTDHLVLAGGVTSESYSKDLPASFRPAWSPDSQSLAYVRSRNCEPAKTDVWVARTDLLESKRISPAWAGGSCPAWSPDGRFVAMNFTADSEGAVGILMADLDQRVSTIVLSDGLANFSPAWAPRGSLIAFATQTPASKIVPRLIRPGAGAEFFPEDRPGRLALLDAKARWLKDAAATKELDALASEMAGTAYGPAALLAAAQAYIELGSFAAAVRCAKRADELSIDPKKAVEARACLLDAYIRAGDMRSASNYWNKLPTPINDAERATLERRKALLDQFLMVARENRGAQAVFEAARLHEEELLCPAAAAREYHSILKLYPQWKRWREALDGYLRCQVDIRMDGVDWFGVTEAVMKIPPANLTPRDIALSACAAARQRHYRRALDWALKLDLANDIPARLKALAMEALRLTAALAENNNDLTVAALLYAKGAAIDAENRSACYLGLARASVKSGLHLNAIDAFANATAASRTALQLYDVYAAIIEQPEQPAYLPALADFHRHVGLTEDAANYLLALLEKDLDEHVEARAREALIGCVSQLADRAAQAGKFDAAVPYLKAANSACPSPKILLKLSQLYSKAGMQKEADAASDEIIKTYPQSVEAQTIRQRRGQE